VAETMARAFPSSPAAIKDLLKEFEDIGVDEVVLYSGSDDISEVDRLAEVIA
jgi:hypothetical protein